MSKILSVLFFALLFLNSCRTLGSWYSLTPPPVNQIDISIIDEKSYLAERINYNHMIYDLIIIDPVKISVKIMTSPDAEGLSFSKVRKFVETEEKQLLFALNGGMYQENRKPLGYLASEGTELAPINRQEGYGNFYLKPNGVFHISEKEKLINAEISESNDFLFKLNENDLNLQVATQSGPLLLYRGIIHEGFTQGSSNKYIRNGVGIITLENKNLIAFVISDRPVNFYDFALFFRDFLYCENALYLDGHISAMYLPDLNRNQSGGSFGTVIYALE